MNEQENSLKKSNLRLAIFLGTVALLLAMLPLYYLRQSVGS